LLTRSINLAEASLVERRAGVVLGQHLLELWVVALDGGHGVVDKLADGGFSRLVLQPRPARLGLDPEDVLGPVLVRIPRVGALVALGLEPGVYFIKRVGDVVEEDQPQNDMLVLGDVHRAAQRVRHLPELSLVADVGGGFVLRSRVPRASSHSSS